MRQINQVLQTKLNDYDQAKVINSSRSQNKSSSSCTQLQHQQELQYLQQKCFNEISELNQIHSLALEEKRLAIANLEADLLSSRTNYELQQLQYQIDKQRIKELEIKLQLQAHHQQSQVTKDL